MNIESNFSSGLNKLDKPSSAGQTNVDSSESPVKEDTQTPAVDTPESLDEEYIFHRTVTILPVTNYSLYRKANDKYLPSRRDSIGSSVASSRTLSSNKDEVDAYFPNIIGLSPSHPDFVFRVKAWLNNISVLVTGSGVTFDTSIRFRHKRDYIFFKTKFDTIEATYERNKLGSLEKLKKALEIKINDLNLLESTLWKVGTPLNVEEYLLYRHCLLYSHVAKDTAIINSSSDVRFYIKDDVKDAENQNKLRLALNAAKVNFVKLLGNNKDFEDVYVQMCAMTGRNVIASIAQEVTTKQNELDTFSHTEPEKFNKMCQDKDGGTKATIEKLIAYGQLIRSPYNQNITTAEGTLIGANIKEAVAWFKDPANLGSVTSYINKLAYI